MRAMVLCGILTACLGVAAPGPGSAEPAAPVAAARTTALWHLPASADGMRIVGEAGTLSWPVYVPAQAAPTLKRFQIGFQAALQVMPEASWLTVSINGQALGRVPIAAPTGVKTLLVDIPPGVAQPGWNAVAISITQAHRVDCTVASTYELWTRIDPATTGFLGGPPKIASLADLPALPTDGSGATPLHLLLPREPSPTDLGRAVKVAERVALRGHFLHPVVDTAPAASGLQIAVGTPGALAWLPNRGAKPGPGTTLDPGRDGAPLLVVSAATEDELDQAIEEFGRGGPDAVGTEEGLGALARQGGRRLKPGTSLSFDELGIRSRTFNGRLFHDAFDVVLPPDAYPADYAEAQLTLDGGYAAGLTEDARFTVRVNGIIDGNLDFVDPRGVVLQRRVIHMPLDPFHPGHNRIEIEAQLPNRADGTCDAIGAIGAKERFLLLGTSRLSLPPLARVAQFPNLAASLSGNLRVTPREAPRFFLPRATDAAVSAVATLLANASVDTGTPADAVFQRGVPQSGAGPAIVVATSADLPASLLGSAGIDAPTVAAAWRAAGRPAGSAAPGLAAREATDTARLDAWGQSVDDRWLGGFGASLQGLGDKLTASLRAAGLLRYADSSLPITADTSFVFAQGMADDTPLTLVTARDDRSLAAGAVELTEPTRLAGLDGRAASFDDGASGATLVPARDTTFFRTQDLSMGNDRLVAAGWVSKHAAWYIGAVLLAVLLLGGSTSAFLVLSRRKQAP